MQLIRKMNFSSLLLVVVLLTIVGYQAFASRPIQRSPAVVASVNLPAVLEGLEQWSRAEADLRDMVMKMEQEGQRRERELNEKRTQIENLRRSGNDAATREEVRRLEEDLVRGSLRFQAWLRVNSDQVDVEKALMLQSIFQSIRRAIKEMASTEGIDMVIVDNAGEEFLISRDSPRSREAQVLQQISERKLMFVNPSFDITRDLVQRMNNEFRAGSPN